jgi:hypothetical protein
VEFGAERLGTGGLDRTEPSVRRIVSLTVDICRCPKILKITTSGDMNKA